MTTYPPYQANVDRMWTVPMRSCENPSPDRDANRHALDDHHCHHQMLIRDYVAAINYWGLVNVCLVKCPNPNRRMVWARNCLGHAIATMFRPIQITVADSFCNGNETKRKNKFQIKIHVLLMQYYDGELLIQYMLAVWRLCIGHFAPSNYSQIAWTLSHFLTVAQYYETDKIIPKKSHRTICGFNGYAAPPPMTIKNSLW